MYSRIQTLEWRQDGGDSYGLYTEVQQHIILLPRIKLRGELKVVLGAPTAPGTNLLKRHDCITP